MSVGSYDYNITLLEIIASALKTVVGDVTFIGGCTTILLVDEAAYSGVRQTEDVDIIVDVTTLVEYRKFEKLLRGLGFREDKEGPICRWYIKDGEAEITLDVMPISEEILEFSNRCYSEAIEHANIMRLPSGTEIKVVTAAHFLATKFEAFHSRGEGDYYSHDLEDIVFVLENRKDLVKELFDCSAELKAYFAEQAAGLLKDDFLNVLLGLVSGTGGERQIVSHLKLMRGWA
ncbi:MAG: hypothetical protein JKX91_00445 [Rhizobiaceae bacterium]|nr:hypothetical protein [Rhizobiaceae bacterium]